MLIVSGPIPFILSFYINYSRFPNIMFIFNSYLSPLIHEQIQRFLWTWTMNMLAVNEDVIDMEFMR
jgi:hypothetical protein